jgi:hypothetical protein
MEFAASNPIFCPVDNIAEKEIMANVSKLIIGAAITVASISTPALAAHKGKPISAHHIGYVTRSSQGRGVYNFVPVAPSVYDSGPHDTPFSAGGG